MKKSLTLATAFGLLAAVLLLTFSACKKETSSGLNITGKWAATVESSQLVTRFEFKSDHTFESSVTAIDSATKETLGIMSKSTGKYEIKNSQLKLYDRVNYANKNNQYGTAAELVTTDAPKTSNYSVTLNDQGNTLSLLYICGPAENCVPLYSVYYTKQ
jgi:hypothetical protein